MARHHIDSIKSKVNGAINATAVAAVQADDAIKAKLATARKEVKAAREERDAQAARAAEAQAKLDELAALKAAQPNHRDAVQDRLTSAIDEFMAEFEAPSWKRVIAGAVFGIMMSACSGWIIGMAVGYVISAVMLLTSSAFLGWAIYVLGLIASMVTGMAVGSKAFSFVTSGAIDTHVSAARSKVSGWFKSKPVELFSGAHAVGAA